MADSNVAALKKFLHAYTRTTLTEACAQTQDPDGPKPQLVIWLYRLGTWAMLPEHEVRGLWAAKRLRPNRSLCGLLLKDLFNLDQAQYESVRKNFETRLTSGVSGIYEAKEVENKFAIVVQLPDTVAFNKGLMYAGGATLAGLATLGLGVYGPKWMGSKAVPVQSEINIGDLVAQITRLEQANKELQAKIDQSAGGESNASPSVASDVEKRSELHQAKARLSEGIQGQSSQREENSRSVRDLRVQNIDSLEEKEVCASARDSAECIRGWETLAQKCQHEKQQVTALNSVLEEKLAKLQKKWEPNPDHIYGETIGDPHEPGFMVTVNLGIRNQKYTIEQGVSEHVATHRWKLNVLANVDQTPGQALAALCSDQPELARASQHIRLFNTSPFQVHDMHASSLYCNSVFKVSEVRVNAALMDLQNKSQQIERNSMKCKKVFEIYFEHLVIPYIRMENLLPFVEKYTSRTEVICIQIDDENVIVRTVFWPSKSTPTNGDLASNVLLKQEVTLHLYLTFKISTSTVSQLQTEPEYNKVINHIYYQEKNVDVKVDDRFTKGPPPYFTYPTKSALLV